MKTFNVSPELQPALEQMSRDMAVPVEGLVNQALFNWAKLHGYLEPSRPAAEVQVDGKRAAEPPVTQVVLVLSDREVLVDSQRFLVGRDVSCDLTIDSARLSRQHAAVNVTGAGVEVEDLGSSNGTWFLGERIERRKLVHGDEVHFGDTLVRVEFREVGSS